MTIEVQDGQIMLPGNAAAEEVRRRREENADLDEQLRMLRRKQLENSEVIGQMQPLAVWVPSGETVQEEPAEGTLEPDENPEGSGSPADDRPEAGTG